MSPLPETLTLLPQEKIEKLQGRQIVWGQLPEIYFTVLVNSRLPIKVSDKGTQYFDADLLASVDPSRILRPSYGNKYDPIKLIETLHILAELQEYQTEAFDTSLLEPEVVQALEKKWFFHNELLGTDTDLHIFGKVINVCKAIEEQLGRKCIVTAGSMQYVNAQVLSYVSPRFLKLNLLHDDAAENIREKLLNLVGKEQTNIPALEQFANQKEELWKKAEEAFSLLNEKNEVVIRQKAYDIFVAISEEVKKVEQPELKLIHLSAHIAKHEDNLHHYIDFRKIAFSYVVLALLSEYVSELLSEIFAE